jgi:hypothetical protein
MTTNSALTATAIISAASSFGQSVIPQSAGAFAGSEWSAAQNRQGALLTLLPSLTC